jgi:hypothetical protein
MSSQPLYFPQGFALTRALQCAQLVAGAYAQYDQWQAQDRRRRPREFVWQAPDFAAHYNALQVPTFRLVNDSDLVPQIPPGVTGDWLYQHLGLAVTFSASYADVAANHSLADCYLYALQNPQAPMR